MNNDITSLNVSGAGEATASLPPVTHKKRRINHEAVVGTFLASIPLIGFLIFGLLPLVVAMAMAFMDTSGFSVFDGDEFFSGSELFTNFQEIFEDPVFKDSIGNTFILGSSTVISLVLSLVIAYFLSKPIVGRKTFRMIYFVPYVCSVVAVTLMWKNMFNTEYGIINQLLGKRGEINWMGDSKYFSWAVIIMSVWSGMGYSIILFTAALTNVNSSMVEAAKIDGAGAARTFFSIIFPSISPTTFYLFIMGVIGALQSFATTNVLSETGGPNNDGVTIVFYLYKRVFNYYELGTASATAWILAGMILFLTVAQFLISRWWVNYDN